MESRADCGRTRTGCELSDLWPPELEYARAFAKLEAGIDHVRGADSAPVIIEYGDYECPYSRQAFHSIERVERSLRGQVRFAFRHFPLTEIHPHALEAAMAAEAAALQRRFWEMHGRLFHHQHALEDEDLRTYAHELGLAVGRFDSDRASGDLLARVRRDVATGKASGEVKGTPTLFIDGVVHRGGYDAEALLQAVAAYSEGRRVKSTTSDASGTTGMSRGRTSL